MNTSDAAPYRIGAVRYLNSRPLVEDLSALLPDAEITFDYPSRLADRLREGELDVALIPSVEHFRMPETTIVSDACVAARGPVLSVRLYCRVQPGDIRTLALDDGSRTSASLARILLAEKYGVIPSAEQLSLDSDPCDTGADAILIIGDRAMHVPREPFVEVIDLGEAWYRWTGLPFVFAMWVVRPGVETEKIAAALSEARDRGVRQLDRIASESAPKLNIPEDLARNYLRNNLHFRMTSAEQTGLRLFREFAASHGLTKRESHDRISHEIGV